MIDTEENEKDFSIEVCPNCQDLIDLEKKLGPTIVCTSCGLEFGTRYAVDQVGNQSHKDETPKNHFHRMEDYDVYLAYATAIDFKACKTPDWKRWAILDGQREYDTATLASSIVIITQICKKATIPTHVTIYASKIFRKAFVKKLAPKTTIAGLILSSIIIACRVHGVPRPLPYIQKMSGYKVKRIHSVVNLVRSELKIRVHPMKLSKYITFYVDQCNFDLTESERQHFERKVKETLNHYRRVYRNKKSGKASGFLAASIRFISQKYHVRISDAKLSAVFDIDPKTMLTRYQELITCF